jgi:uncharacterized damage-inducible protein DinB
MKIKIILLLVIATLKLNAQNNSYAKSNLKIWKNAKSITLAVANAMPEDKYNYRPTEDVKSFGQQMAHIANSMRSMEMRFLNDAGWNQSEPNANDMTKNELIKFLESSFGQVIATIDALSETDLTKAGKQFGDPALNKEQSIHFIYDHITNHRAKAVLYLRLNKINPPAYRFN